MDASLQANIATVQARIARAARLAGRPATAIRLLAVSKSAPAQAIAAAARCGVRAFGENYVQEADDKIPAVAQLLGEAAPAAGALEWHFIGPIQSNKTRAIAARFDWVQSVDRLRVAQRLAEQRPAGRAPLNVLLEVNISGEDSKSGVAPDQLPSLAAAVAALPRLRLRGLMAIPAPAPDPQANRPAFDRMRALYEALRAGGLPLDTLSIGMSADLEVAIAAGATMVRIGTAIFGERR